MLQSKIEELETLLGNLFTSPPAESPCHPLHADDVEQRLLFLKNLLAADSTSNPSGLHRIDRRLSQLEAAFRAWDGIRLMKTTSFRSLPLDDHLTPLEDDGDYSDDQGEAEQLSSSVEEEMDRERKAESGGRYLVGMGCGVVVGAVFTALALGMLHFHSCFNHDHPFPSFPTPT